MTILSNLIGGVSLGSIYAIIALGYTMVYGIAKMLNFAHGDVIMVGGYLCFCAASYLNWNPVAAVLLAMVYSLIPFMILPCYSSVEKVDWSYVEASRDLGAGPARAFLTVTFPLTLPGVMAGCVLVFVPSVGLFFVSDLMGGSLVLVGNLIRDQLLKSRDWPFGAALSVVLMAVTIVIFGFYRRSGGDELGVF